MSEFTINAPVLLQDIDGRWRRGWVIQVEPWKALGGFRLIIKLQEGGYCSSVWSGGDVVRLVDPITRLGELT